MNLLVIVDCDPFAGLRGAIGLSLPLLGLFNFVSHCVVDVSRILKVLENLKFGRPIPFFLADPTPSPNFAGNQSAQTRAHPRVHFL